MKTKTEVGPRLKTQKFEALEKSTAAKEKLRVQRSPAVMNLAATRLDSIEKPVEVAAGQVSRTLGDRVVDVLKAHNVEHVTLSALGSTEHSLGTAIGRSDLPISLYHSESGAVSEAVGYNQVRGTPAAVLVTHSTPGTANSWGHLWDAVHKGGVPLVVLVGEADLTGEHKHMDGDPVEMSKGHINFAERVRNANQVESVIKRAFEATAKPGHGPAMVVLPQSLMASVEGKLQPVTSPRQAETTLPHKRSVDDVMSLFANPAQKWAIVVGDGVKRSGAAEVVSKLAKEIGAPIFKGLSSQAGNTVDRDAMVTKQLSHMQFADTRDTLAKFENVLLIGTPPNSYVFSEGGNPLAGRNVVAISENLTDLQRTVGAKVIVRANEKATVQSILDRLEQPAFDQTRKVGSERSTEIQQTNIAAAKANREGLLKQAPFTHLWTEKLLKAVDRIAPDAAIHDESITNSGHMQAIDRDGTRKQGDDQNTLGGALGTWVQGNGMATALKKVVLTVMGDYGFYETMQALRAATVNRLPTAYVVYDNGGGEILKGNAKALDGRAYNPPEGRNIYEITSAEAKDSRYDLIAKGQGLTNSRLVTSPAEFHDAASQLIASAKAGNPMLVHLKIPPSAINADNSTMAAWVANADGKPGGELQVFGVKDALGDPELTPRNTLKLDLTGVKSARFNDQGGVELLDGAGSVLRAVDQAQLARPTVGFITSKWSHNIFDTVKTLVK